MQDCSHMSMTIWMGSALRWHPHIWSMVDAFSLHPTPANSKLLALTNPWLDDRSTRNICCTNSSKHGERIIWSVYTGHLMQAHEEVEMLKLWLVTSFYSRTKRVLWKLAIVKELLTGVDGRVRAAVVQVSGSRNLLKRSTCIKHLIPIKVQSNVIR